MHSIRNMFIISRTFARGHYSLIVSDLLRCLWGRGLGVEDEVVVGVGWSVRGREREIQWGMHTERR